MEIKLLQEIPIFEDLEEEELQKIANIIVEKKYKKNDYLYFEGEKGNSMHIIKAGRVKVFNSSENGRENIIATFTEGDFFGEMALIDENSTRSASIQAMEDVETYIIYKEDFIELLKGSFYIMMRLLSTLNDRIRKLNKKVEILTYEDVYARFLDTMDELIEKYGIKKGKTIVIDISLTHQELANMLGVTRETASRIISKLRKEEIIQIENKKIIILDEEKLKKCKL